MIQMKITMANTAYGWIDFFYSNLPTPLVDLNNILAKYPQLFSYGCEYNIEHFDHKLTVHFTSRWTTEPVWDLLEELMDGSVLGTWLASVKIKGKGREDGLGHYVLVKKSSGDLLLKRKNN